MHLQLEGGCELTEHGVFNVFLRGRGKQRAPLDPKEVTLKEWIREHYDFIMTDDHEGVVAGRRIVRRMTRGKADGSRPPLPILEATLVGGLKMRLIRMERSGYCVLALELPFLTDNSDGFRPGGWGSDQDEGREDDRWEEETQ